jgi:hypothetical protein
MRRPKTGRVACWKRLLSNRCVGEVPWISLRERRLLDQRWGILLEGSVVFPSALTEFLIFK